MLNHKSIAEFSEFLGLSWDPSTVLLTTGIYQS